MESKSRKSKLPQESVIKKTPKGSGTILRRLESSPERSRDKSSKSGKSQKAKTSFKVTQEKKDTSTKSCVITKGLVGSPSESGVIFKRPSDTSCESELMSKRTKDIIPGFGDDDPSETKEATQVSGLSTKESAVIFKRPRDIPCEPKEVTQKSVESPSEVRKQSVLVSPSGSSARPKSIVVTPETSTTRPKSVVVSQGGSGVKPKSVVVATGTSLLKPRSVVVSPGGSGIKPKSVVVAPGIKRKTYVTTAGISGLKSASFSKASSSEDKGSSSGDKASGSGDQASGSGDQASGSVLQDSGSLFHTSGEFKGTTKAKKRQNTDDLYFESDETEKILVAADVEGKFDIFFPKIKQIERKIGGISFVLCIGNFFGNKAENKWKLYSEGSKKVPLDTYILGPVNPKQVKYYPRMERHKNGKFIDLADKVFYLGKLGIFTTKTGLNIAFLSGMESTESTSYSYNDEDVNELIVMLADPSNNLLPIDIFVCCQWPTNIASDCPAQNSSDLLQMVVKALVPRYVFSGTEGVWYKRNPYINEYPYEFVYTRFIGLGKFDSNQKAIFAVELKKEIERLKVKKLDESPFKNVIIYPGHVDFRWDPNAMNGSVDKDDSSGEEQVGNLLESKGKLRCHVPNRDICWFCLSSSDFEDYYMLHLGTHCYVARAKGGLLIEHLVIATVNHVRSYQKLTKEVKNEVNNLKIIVRSYYKDKACCPVFFERNLKSSVHFIMDAVPIQLSHASEVKAVFKEYAEKYNLSIQWYPDFNSLELPKDDKSQYFWAELPNREVLYIPVTKSFPAFFGRMVLADPKLLDKTSRIHWRNGIHSIDKELEYSQACRIELATCI